MRKERKIYNYESIVLRDMTFEKEGYWPESLGKTSNKFIYAICRVCGEPSRLRNGQFIKSSSACHKECRLKEQKQSPFSDPEVRAKISQTNLIRYGSEFASANKDIAKKISKTKMTEASKQKSITSNMKKYGVENVFQNEDIKKKIKAIMIEKYGVKSPLQNPEIKTKIANTNLEKYNVINPAQNEDIKAKIIATNMNKYGTSNPMQNADIVQKAAMHHKNTVIDDPNDNYILINTLRNEDFWKMLSSGQYSLRQVCNKFGINYQSVTSRLLTKEFKDKYYELYSFPKQAQQKIIFNTFKSLGFDCSMNDRSVISPLEIDVYINSQKVGIEYNGSFWHSEAFLSSQEARQKHWQKTNICRKSGIRLFHVFEHEWLSREKQILNLIKSKLGCNDIHVGARKCDVIETDGYNKESRKFMDENHIQGFGDNTLKCFNLVYNESIVASITASFHHRQNINGNPIVLNRLCFKDSYNISGGSSKLFSHLVKWAKSMGYDRIISWSDNRWTEGDIYGTLGFSFAKEYGPDYFYWDHKNAKYVSKQSQRKKKTGCPANVTEREWCFERGLYRIWDCGKKLWEYRL